MKKAVAAFVILIFVGILLTGIGCAVFFSKGIKEINLEYYEQFFESEEEISSLNLDLGNAHKVVLQRGEKCSVKYFDTNVTNFTVSVENGRLNIHESGWSWKDWLKRIFYRYKSTDVVITVPENAVLDIVGDFSGATEMTLPSWEYGNIRLDVSGAAAITASDITAKDITIEASGSTDFSISSGKVNSLTARASGSVKLKCDGLECPRIEVRASGSARMELSGIGKDLVLRVSGSGRVYAKDFALETADIDASGSANAELSVSTLLKVRTSGSSNIAYWGNPEVDRYTSGSSTIVKKG
ncbi:MAG: DUF2807 domain-containing protein [Clostridia bacterium]|nr:DUF2807 domain-containing protein [Clostridia bacterium]